jgi:hypothetical protein
VLRFTRPHGEQEHERAGGDEDRDLDEQHPLERDREAVVGRGGEEQRAGGRAEEPMTTMAGVDDRFELGLDALVRGIASIGERTSTAR